MFFYEWNLKLVKTFERVEVSVPPQGYEVWTIDQEMV